MLTFFEITVGRMEHHLTLYAHDVIVFPKNTNESNPALLDLIQEFGKICGCKINNLKHQLCYQTKKREDPPELSAPLHLFRHTNCTNAQ